MKFEVFGDILSPFFQVYTSVYDTSDHDRRWFVHFDLNLVLRRQFFGVAGPAGVPGSLGAGRVAWPLAVAGVGLADVCEENTMPASFQFRICP